MISFVRKMLVAGCTLGAAVSANAFLVDFTDADKWTDGGNPQSTMYGDLQVTITAYNGTALGDLNFQSFDGGADKAFCQSQGGAFACDFDGAGVDDDEITYTDGTIAPVSDVQAITVAFSRAVSIDSLHFLDLFQQSASDGIPEVAQWAARGASGLVGSGSATGTAVCPGACAGFLSVVGLGYTGVTSIDFFADTAFSISSPANSDFALAGIGVVPIPPAVALFGSFLLGLAGWNSRKRRAI